MATPDDNTDFIPLEWPYPIPLESIVIQMTYQGEPVSKARARMGRSGKFYTPEKTKSYEMELAWRMREILGDIQPDATSRFALRCLFYRSTRQRIDCDNLLKAVSDAANGQVWKDDAQVTEVIGRLFLASDNPRVEIIIHTVIDPAPKNKCEICGEPTRDFKSTKGRFCSVACYNKSLEMKRINCNCAECGEPFQLNPSAVRSKVSFCSRSCSAKYHTRKRNKGRESSNWRCIDCGKPVSRKEYTRCQSCSMVHRQEPTSNYWQQRHKS